MARPSDARIIRLGVVTLVIMALVSAATFNLGKFPGFRGTTYYAEFSDASGIHKGNIVQVGGIRVGRVAQVTLAGDRVRVKFELDGDVDFGKGSRASIEVLNLLGEKYLQIEPDTKGQLAEGGTIPLEQTTSAYDIVDAFGDLATTTEEIDTGKLTKALSTVADTLDAAAPEVRGAFDGIARLSKTISSRDEEVQTLFHSAQSVSTVLDQRKDDIVGLMKSSDLVFQELTKRKQAVHDLLINARTLARELRGLVTDNEAQIGPALKEVDGLVSFLLSKQKKLKETLAALGPYVSILSNIIGTGPWFDAYAANLLTLPVEASLDVPKNEFVPGFPEVD